METDNVVYLDEYRKEHWLKHLEFARETGQLAIFGAVYEDPAQLILFPRSEGTPDDAA